MSTVFIFHGIGGGPSENWLPWLKQKLEAGGHRAIVPTFPHTDQPLLSEWWEYFGNFRADVDQDTILVGHSLGGAFALRLLEKLKAPINSCFLIAPVSGPLANTFDPLMKTFSHPPFDWPTIRDHCRKFFIFHSDNDPYIPLSDSERLAENLKAELTVIPSGGHLNQTAGFTTFPLLLEKIHETLS